MPLKVLMTGAHGRVGSAIRRHLGDDERYEWTYLDHSEHSGYEAVVGDVRDYDAIRPAFDGQDAVVHLALTAEGGGEFDPGAPWGASFSDELEATCNVYGAAIDAGVEKMVYASSAQVISKHAGEWAIGHSHPDEYEEPDERITVDDPVRPNDLYGVTKAFGEDFGRFCHEAYGLRVYCIRIGWLLAADGNGIDHPYAAAERGVREGHWERDSDEYEVETADQKWLSHRDAARLFDLCLRDETVGFDVFHGISDNEGRWLSIEHAREVLGYDPQDDVAEWDGPPESA
jgi:nucleoside-diphosphate-sugar epimerase